MKNFQGLLAHRKYSANRLPKRHNVTLDGSESLLRQTSPKNRTKLLTQMLDEDDDAKNNNTIQNYIETCKNAQKKRVKFDDLIAKLPSNDKRGDLSLFSQMRNSKQQQNHNTLDTPFEKMEFKLGAKQRTLSKTSSQLLETSNLDFKLIKEKQIEKLTKEVETDSENFLNQSITSLTKEEQKQIRQQVITFKQKAFQKLKIETQSITNISQVIHQIKSEINNQIDRLIDNTLVKRKTLYKLAQQEVKSYFKKIDSKKKGHSTTRTNQSTPCFDDKSSAYAKEHKQVHDRCSVRAFQSISDNNELAIEPNNTVDDTVKVSSSLKTQDNRPDEPRSEQSSRFTFTIDSRRKSSRNTKRIKDSIISGRVNMTPPEHQQSVTIQQFNP